MTPAAGNELNIDRVGKILEYDGATGPVKNGSEANALLSKNYRQG